MTNAPVKEEACSDGLLLCVCVCVASCCDSLATTFPASEFVLLVLPSPRRLWMHINMRGAHTARVTHVTDTTRRGRRRAFDTSGTVCLS